MIKKLRQYEHLEPRELIDKVVEIQSGNSILDDGSLLSLMLCNPVAFMSSINIKKDELNKALSIFDIIIGDGVAESPWKETLIDILSDDNYNDTLIHNLCVAMQNPAEVASTLFNISDDVEYYSTIISVMDKRIPVKYMSEVKNEIALLARDEDEDTYLDEEEVENKEKLNNAQKLINSMKTKE